MNGGNKIGVRVQTASKALVRKAGFRPAPHEEEEDHLGDVIFKIQEAYI
jgi:hypothetical protein